MRIIGTVDLPEAHGSESGVRRTGQIDHYLYFPTKDAATRASIILRAEGQTIQVSRGSDEASWLVLVSCLPESPILVLGSDLERLAISLGGKYDGEEAAL